ncbi:hypothetical protein NEOLEDRAFT_842583 [Neolentinus lepideus HHB14362 ss-1]|uniref:Uncharacterized protein n=1 Tax=Neolentinus lepideus HHB14362 ss-1 TaxID=1314782 RepID=A0A165P4Z0_9AGAM|nr:hypothetical protein NEOLEDRAFT_842583 [Neolentinus lepideus HHB14362 ss-1]
MKAIGIRLLQGILRSIAEDPATQPAIFEALWLPLSVSWGELAGDLFFGYSGLQLKIPLPWSISDSADKCLSQNTPLRLQLLQGPSAPTFTELHSDSFRLLGRFMHEWNAVIDGNELACSVREQYYCFPQAIQRRWLHHLCARLADMYLGSPEVPDIVRIVTQKDRDCCDAMLDILRHQQGDVTEIDNEYLPRHDTDSLFSFEFGLRSIIKVTLHGVGDDDGHKLSKSIWRVPGSRPGQYAIRDHPRKVRVKAQELLIGDWNSLRWVHSTDLSASDQCYKLIIGGLDSRGRPLYVASIQSRTEPIHICLVGADGENFQMQHKRDLAEWNHQQDQGFDPLLYVLASRRLPKDRKNDANGRMYKAIGIH